MSAVEVPAAAPSGSSSAKPGSKKATEMSCAPGGCAPGKCGGAKP
jgi:hypothetical protein